MYRARTIYEYNNSRHEMPDVSLCAEFRAMNVHHVLSEGLLRRKCVVRTSVVQFYNPGLTPGATDIVTPNGV
jgi:hypothetical protein